MTDAEISRRLALAIGYKPEHVREPGILVWSDQPHHGFSCIGWYKFDYRDPAVIWPIAERFNAFPAKWENEWSAGGDWCDTAAEAVALAVIKALKGAKE